MILCFRISAQSVSLPDKGIWVRPESDYTYATIQLDDMKRAGFTDVFVETFYHGFAIFPSEIVPIRPEMNNKDMLHFYLTEAKKRGMKLHCWIETYYWEVDTTQYPQFPKTTLFDDHPEWRAILRDRNTTEKAEFAHIFANPAHPGVQKLLVDFIREIIMKYPLDGINLDYLRYPSGPPDAGYDDYTTAEYKKLKGLDPRTIPVDPDNMDWREWVEFREDQVLALTRKIKDTKDAIKKEVILSAAIFPGAPENRYKDAHFQNWRKMDYLDVIIPMVYSPTLKGIEEGIMNVQRFIPTGSNIKLMPVLAIRRKNIDAYSGAYHPLMIDQMKIIEKLNLPGFSVFCYSWMMDSEEGLNLFKPGK
ncbi:family 10 glycosylhydrolase [Candidatus Sumerlaeota bacterium]|nr:family 10 glycosylhydrolase [Candidatus Sumerlaeota bacterium]